MSPSSPERRVARIAARQDAIEAARRSGRAPERLQVVWDWGEGGASGEPPMELAPDVVTHLLEVAAHNRACWEEVAGGLLMERLFMVLPEPALLVVDDQSIPNKALLGLAVQPVARGCVTEIDPLLRLARQPQGIKGSRF